jgi:hypothetical protein
MSEPMQSPVFVGRREEIASRPLIASWDRLRTVQHVELRRFEPELDQDVFGRAYGIAFPAAIAGIVVGSVIAPASPRCSAAPAPWSLWAARCWPTRCWSCAEPATRRPPPPYRGQSWRTRYPLARVGG